MVPKISLDKALEFLRLSIGDPGATLSTEGRTVLDHFLLLVNDSKFPFTQALHPDYEADLDDLSRTLSAFCAILAVYRERNGSSINRVLAELVQRNVFAIRAGDSTEDHSESAAKQCIFATIGLTSLLYLPIESQQDGLFQINSQGAKCFSKQSISINLAARPTDEILRALGEVLPKSNSLLRLPRDPGQPSQKFHVSHLNAATLKRLAGVEIAWVSSVGAHLQFDPAVSTLYVFRLPSFCRLHQTRDSIISV